MTVKPADAIAGFDSASAMLEATARGITGRPFDRHVFQVGAQGGVDPEDYDRRGIVPDTEAAEAEWGFDPLLLDDVNQFGARTGHPVHVVHYPDTHALSGPIAGLCRDLLIEAGLAADRLLVESFLLMDPTRARETGLVPLWTIFPVEAAVRVAEDHLRSNHYRSVHIGLFPHGVESQGIAKPERWREALRGTEIEFLGVDTKRYPADFAALVRYGAALRAMPRLPVPQPGALSVDVALKSLTASLSRARDVSA